MTSPNPIKVLCVGAGNTGRSHILACHELPGFKIVGICTRTSTSRASVLKELDTAYPEFDDYETALRETQPDAVCIATYLDTHYTYTRKALEAGCHVFVEKPLAKTVEEAAELIALAEERRLKLVVGYVLRHHPSWSRFIELAQGLGRPLVMRMNLNQQSSGSSWEVHKNLMASVSPIVDCGVHYVDVMCQMTKARPVRISGIGARLTNELPAGKINYGHLQVTFDDGSVGWYEAGWGPMMSETAFFVKDVVGPLGSVSIVADKSGAEGQSANVDAHSGTENLRLHHGQLTADGRFNKADEILPQDNEPSHDELFQLEQAFFLRAIKEDLDLNALHQSTIDSMRIVLAADESFRTGKTIEL
jgi:predicted dehydrogenase